MTEQEWMICTEPRSMLYSISGEASERKLRLFAAACCRRLWPLLTEQASRDGVEVLERYADRRAGEESLVRARKGAESARRFHLDDSRHTHAGPGNAALAVVYALGDRKIGILPESAGSSAAGTAAAAIADAVHPHSNHPSHVAALGSERHTQSLLLREIIGNPFRRIDLALAWYTPNVVGIAEGIYEEKAFDRMPFLADALMDAGCFDEEIIGHCRQPGEHMRGCWVVDLVLRKE